MNMKYIISESQYDKILSEQSNVYSDKKEYDKALSNYKKQMAIYQMSLELYKERSSWSKDYTKLNPAFWTPNLRKLSKLAGFSSIDIPYFMDYYYRCKNNLPSDNGYKMSTDYCRISYNMFKQMGNPIIEKWNKIPTYYDNGERFNQNMWVPIFKKPNILKPIFKILGTDNIPKKPTITTHTPKPEVKPNNLPKEQTKLYQGYDFTQKTGLRPGYYTDSQVQDAINKKIK